jgi:methionyl-tRNA formyltransferase
MVKVLQGKAFRGTESSSMPGAILRLDNELVIQTGDGLYQIDVIQPAGKRRMTGHEFLAGHSSVIGLVCGNPSP